ncbi:hypothetical protein BTA37_28450 [Priestia megaterium]|uniref:hypothetical protein n=1 Tax=Priestia megaterium TaxID=1404 RepID=UPI00094C89CE|nr:hypothetical protein [Priestia megaterium]OLO26234.1 hypothetical protein BTA37_28450 [Priestia megaterium]
MIKRNIDILIDTASWGGKLIPSGISTLASKTSIEIDLLDILIHVAKRTSLPISHGFSLGDLWAWLRYLPAISNDVNLKLREEWEEIDSHQKTILSDDMGMGFSSSILSQCLKLIFICPTNYLVDMHPSISLRKNGKRGPDKSPDFIAVDTFGGLHIIECKGTQSNRRKLDEQLNTGYDQKNNVLDPSGFINEKLVSGVFIPQYSSTERGVFRIKDPEFPLDFSNVKKEDIIETIILGEIASMIHLLGFPKLGNSIATNHKLDPKDLERIEKEIESLDTIKIEGKIFSKVDVYHRVDYSEFIDSNPYGIKIEIAIDLDFIRQLLTESDFMNITKKIRKSIENQQLSIIDNETGGNWTKVSTPLGFHIKLEIVS